MYLALGIVYLIVSIVMAAIIAFTTVRSIKNNGNFITKKNLFYLAPTFLVIYLLHITAELYNKADLDFFSCFSLIYTSLDVMRFKAAKEILLPLCKAYNIYYVDFIVAFIIAGITVILSVASFFSRRIGNFFKVRHRLGKGCDIVVGDSDSAIQYIKNHKSAVILGADMSNQNYMDLIKKGMTVLRTPMASKNLARRIKRGEFNIIVFRDAEQSYTKIIETFMGLPQNADVRIYLEANQQEMKILKQKFIAKADNVKHTYISGFSKYELMARRFVVDYPITKYIPRYFYNDNFTLKPDKDIHIVFIGFGKVNYQLFRMCAMQFQFAHEKSGKLVSHPIKYHIYDCEKRALYNEFFSRMDYEFDEVFSDCDFPKPEKICQLADVKQLDSNSVDAKKAFKSFVTKDSFTYFIISLDNDLEDASYAQTIMRMLNENDNYRIFVRAKNSNGEKLNEDGDKIIYFGDEKGLYTHDNIINDDLTELAQKINLLYSRIADPPAWLKGLYENKNLNVTQQSVILNRCIAEPERKAYMLEKWGELPNIEQDSNLYHALNLPFKLNLLGFDMVKRRDENDLGITEEEFNKYYINSGRAEHYSDYSFFFKTESSNVLAFIEHSRWNALYILYDYKQMKKADMNVVDTVDKKGNPVKSMPHKNTDLKQHACITTYYGLNELIEYKYKTMYPDEAFDEKHYKDNAHLTELGKIYAYDYMDLDRLYSEITAMGYKLVRNDGEN
ncbi:MAG: hypothetical protein K2O39_07335 [Clostridiales bacterium]|nr:hypothetical protein [Clostridiales bacterium]